MAAMSEQAKELEKLVEATRRRTDLLVKTGMDCAQAGDISRLERSIDGLKDAIKNPKLPRDFIFAIQARIREIELVGYRKFIDITLNRARAAAQAHDEKKKFAYLKTAKEYLPKALAAGAGEEFKRDTMRVIDVVEFTGTPMPQKDGSAAKPVDRKAPPPPPNRAKAF